MKDLKTLIDTPEKRTAIVKECAQLIDGEVRKKTGFSGMAVKTTYKIFKTLKPGVVEDSVEVLLDEFVDALNGFYQSYQEAGGAGTLGAYLAGRADDVAEKLLAITDVRAQRTSMKTVANLYNKLRPKAKVHVVQAVPAVGQLLDRHVGSL